MLMNHGLYRRPGFAPEGCTPQNRSPVMTCELAQLRMKTENDDEQMANRFFYRLTDFTRKLMNYFPAFRAGVKLLGDLTL
jgi:hypothetical protein